MVDDMYARLTQSERDRFIADGTGSPESDRWLHAVLGVIRRYNGAPLGDLDTEDGRAEASGEGSREAVAPVVGAFSDGAPRPDEDLSGFVGGCDDPRMVNALDTLIRFAMTRHDVTGPLCGRDVDAAALMERLEGMHERDHLLPRLARHMILPVIFHAGDPADDVFDAISAGYWIRASMWFSDEGGWPRIPMSPCLPYEGPHCGPRLAAMWADDGALSAEIGLATAVTPVSFLITSMPGAADMGIPAAIRTVIDLQPDDPVQGIVGGAGGIGEGTLPPMDWDTYLLAMGDGARALSGLQMPLIHDETAPGYGMHGTAGPGNGLMDMEGLIVPTMSDMAFMVRAAISPVPPDPVLLLDMIRAGLYPGRYVGCGDPRVEDSICGADGAGLSDVVRDVAIHFHDPVILAGARLLWRMSVRARNGRTSDSVLNETAVEAFLRSLAAGLPERFAMETLMASSRRAAHGHVFPSAPVITYIIPDGGMSEDGFPIAL